MAIPQFANFQKKARDSEARTSLGSLYTAQKAFFFEKAAYCSDIDPIGFSVEGANRYFGVGFKNAGNHVATGADAKCKAVPAKSAIASTKLGTQKTQATLTASCKVSAADTFLGCAEGERASSTKDFTINQLKVLN